nr:hypothetical protein [uncultured Draconibacterium sp.]
MKNKYLIELQEITLKSIEVWQRKSYPAPGAYLVTDDSGIKALMIVPQSSEAAILGIYDTPPPHNMLDQFLGEPITEIPELPEPPELLEMPEMRTGISEDALLKAIAVAQKPELILNITDPQND